ncbi:CDP-alcohol phosphatidyltransferase family protein [Microbacterium sp. M3]|uniref:CDP-alcohol phosphatidyltransferase family protein n=1 Tax=Microbacterium arthrosphaerae TaxID=792652 RepID=A0ABU4H1F5_9MICO|nr:MULTISPECIES: CDP-alcohol phosphatidyltransferase family protein [Microbacterium]MDW4571729.1 CDP-alcohol phosphatidyltransferase family protein [Microbacterium arthrosphaerae]MDW7605584.1 CDP-alcohol phosphatidyltransferase family protein [Microbacterium sp. M3]
MRKVQRPPRLDGPPPAPEAGSRAAWAQPWWWVAAGCAGLVAIGIGAPLPWYAGAAGAGYLVVSTLLLTRGLRRRGAGRLGPANAVTATRSTLVGLVTALIVASFSGPVPTLLLVSLTACALVLDGLDGWVARRTASESELGAQFDMEVDAYLLLALCVYDARYVGWWVLIIGLLRYAFVAAGWLLPWMRRTLPPRYWRKVVTAACGVALTVVASQLLPPAGNLLMAAAALALVSESFGRDVLWLIRMNRRGSGIVSQEKASTTSPPEESG